mmetsp:Transcript_36096/g.101607  ORF Transcript_36096/g.101607 Transcript_36096/m.101607 type:complete len:284 (-) Transcript_36096:181-1032(-)
MVSTPCSAFSMSSRRQKKPALGAITGRSCFTCACASRSVRRSFVTRYAKTTQQERLTPPAQCTRTTGPPMPSLGSLRNAPWMKSAARSKASGARGSNGIEASAVPSALPVPHLPASPTHGASSRSSRQYFTLRAPSSSTPRSGDDTCDAAQLTTWLTRRSRSAATLSATFRLPSQRAGASRSQEKGEASAGTGRPGCTRLAFSRARVRMSPPSQAARSSGSSPPPNVTRCTSLRPAYAPARTAPTPTSSNACRDRSPRKIPDDSRAKAKVLMPLASAQAIAFL